MEAAHPGHRTRVDGNAAGGILIEVFGRDMTGARATCTRCDRKAVLGDAVAELDPAGVILLCRGCGHTLLTCIQIDGRYSLDVGTLSRLEWASDGD